MEVGLLVDALLRALRIGFGLDALLARQHNRDVAVAAIDQKSAKGVDPPSAESAPSTPGQILQDDKKKVKKVKKKNDQQPADAELKGSCNVHPAGLERVRGVLRGFFDDEGLFIFSQIADILLSNRHSSNTVTGEDGGGVAEAGVQVPLKLEICSGAGEWAVEQALHDPAALWMTLELRHDRVHQTWTRSELRRARNLLVLGGDARLVLQSRFPSGCLTHVLVNHPEPPQQTGGRNDSAFLSQANHLLDPDFFQDMIRVLAPGGILTIVTDNLWYGRLLVRQVAGDPKVAALRCLSVGADWAVRERVGWCVLYEGHPGTRGGHVVRASSYFDRLWKRGSLVERYFLCLQKFEETKQQGVFSTISTKKRKQKFAPSERVKKPRTQLTEGALNTQFVGKKKKQKW